MTPRHTRLTTSPRDEPRLSDQHVRSDGAKIDYEDYLSHRVAEKAKREVLSYFALATIVVSVLVTLLGWHEMKKLLEEKYEGMVNEYATEATEKFEKRLNELSAKAEKETKEHSLFIASVRSRVTMAGGPASEVVDLSASIGPIRDQGAEGTTVGFSLAYAMNSAWRRARNEDRLFSARSIYVGAQEHDDWPGRDYEGSSLSGGVKALQQIGAALESAWPYTMKSPPSTPPLVRHKIRSHQRLQNTTEIIQVLKSGSVVAVSLNITEEFTKPDEQGKVILRPNSPAIGGHSVAIVGWNESTREFKFANMWGSNWGAEGFAFIRESDLAPVLMEAYRLEV